MANDFVSITVILMTLCSIVCVALVVIARCWSRSAHRSYSGTYWPYLLRYCCCWWAVDTGIIRDRYYSIDDIDTVPVIVWRGGIWHCVTDACVLWPYYLFIVIIDAAVVTFSIRIVWQYCCDLLLVIPADWLFIRWLPVMWWWSLFVDGIGIVVR